MKRNIIQSLMQWKVADNRLPLLMRGARQVGKTYMVEEFGRDHFTSMFTVNFEQHPEFKSCFDTLNPTDILNKIFLLSGQRIIPGETLLFLDEIQECPAALMALRYFYEQLPQLHVIAAGSLLEFTLRNHDFRMPVGRVQSLYLYPLSFQEFMQALGEQALLEHLATLTLNDVLDDALHQKLLGLLKTYWVVGGMPAVVRAYIESGQLAACEQMQRVLIDGYRADFGKYASKTSLRHLQRLYEKAPGLVGKHFQYAAVDPDQASREIKVALDDLIDAGLIKKIQASNASGLPLAVGVNEKKFKLLALDIGLMSRAIGVSAAMVVQDDLLLINQGVLAEQFVGQELLANASPYERESLFYWERAKGTSTAEVDYLTVRNARIYPIEVKAGATGRLRSLKIFVDEKQAPFGIRVSQRPLAFVDGVLSVPLYLLFRLTELIDLATPK